jgi:hypothetical protein
VTLSTTLDYVLGATVAAQGRPTISEASFISLYFTCKIPLLGVEPRGFEPLTSAVQRRHDSLLEVSRVYKIPANKYIISEAVFSRFQDIHSGCCTVAAHKVRSIRLEPAAFC